MDPTMFLLALGFATVAVAFLVWARYHARQAARIGHPMSRLGDARPGPVSLRGKVQGKDLVISPVSERKCLYLRVVIHADSSLGVGLGVTSHRGMSGRHQHVGLQLDSHSDDYVHHLQADHLQLTDGQTEVEVELAGADIELVIDRKFHADASLWDDGEVMKLLRSFGVATGQAPTGKYRLTETILEPGDEVVAVGTLGLDGAGKLLLSGTPDEPLLLTDMDPVELARSSRGKALGGTIGAVLMFVLALGLVVLGVVESLAPSPPPPDTGMQAFDR